MSEENKFSENKIKLENVKNILRKFSLCEVFLIYTWASIILTKLVCFSEFTRAFISLPLFFLIPFLYGETILKLIENIVLVKRGYAIFSFKDKSSYFVVYSLAGFYFIWITAVLFGVLELIYGEILRFIVSNMYIFFIIPPTLWITLKKIGVIKDRDTYHESMLTVSRLKMHSFECLMIILISATQVLITKTFIPFPLISIEHFTSSGISVFPALRMIDDGFFYLGLRWMNFLPIALISSATGTKPLSILWAIPFLLTCVYNIYVYFLACKLSNNRIIGIMTAFLSAFLNNYYGISGQIISGYKENRVLRALFPGLLYVVYDLLSGKKFSSQRKNNQGLRTILLVGTLVYATYWIWNIALFPVYFDIDQVLNLPEYFNVDFLLRPFISLILIVAGLIICHSKIKEYPDKKLLNLIWFIAIILITMHEKQPFILMSNLLAFTILFRIIYTQRWSKLVCYIFIALSFMYIYLQYAGLLKLTIENVLLRILLGSREYIPSAAFNTKKFILETGNTQVVLFYIMIGTILATSYRKRKEYKVMATLLAFMMLMFFSPERSTTRIMFCGMSFAMAFMLAVACHGLSHLLRKSYNLPVSFTMCLLLLILLQSSIPRLYQAYSENPPSYMNLHTSISDYELKAAEWLRENTRVTDRIVSDYITHFHMSGLTGKVWLINLVYPPSLPYINWSRFFNTNGTNILKVEKDIIFNPNRTSQERYEALLTIKDIIPYFEYYYCKFSKIDEHELSLLIVITPRTVEWIEQKDWYDAIVYPSCKTVPEKYVRMFNDKRYFEEIYKIPEKVYIFSVKVHEK